MVYLDTFLLPSIYKQWCWKLFENYVIDQWKINEVIRAIDKSSFEIWSAILLFTLRENTKKWKNPDQEKFIHSFSKQIYLRWLIGHNHNGGHNQQWSKVFPNNSIWAIPPTWILMKLMKTYNNNNNRRKERERVVVIQVKTKIPSIKEQQACNRERV